jgi:hypothetical protein
LLKIVQNIISKKERNMPNGRGCVEAMDLADNMKELASTLSDQASNNAYEDSENTIARMQHVLASSLQAIQSCEAGQS